MKIYIIFEIVDYEPPILLGAYKSRESAKKALQTYVKINGMWNDCTIEEVEVME